ncbi:uncharacterized protein N7443_006050 [Penicillium atrosanguineum]|uniref:uncharacterized protein n=1 Tax=Penicillium atrosanguineum TaxID=1132637 RepID=UPI0023A3A5B4|nr:uncharacterized protein N7443_006050 [Penicillium atrosanguineum]KAJ5301048.1 hypothetical protein N7443_006050 [Penicillium atrosanguineum]
MSPAIEPGTRAVILCLRAIGTPAKSIQQLVGSPISTINGLYNAALKKGFDPDARPLEFNEHITDSPRRTDEFKVKNAGTPTPRPRAPRKKKGAENTEEIAKDSTEDRVEVQIKDLIEEPTEKEPEDHGA